MWAIGAVVFVGYWGIPLTFAAIDGTLLSRSWLLSASSRIVVGGDLVRSVAAAQVIEHGLAYLQDGSHLAFAALLALGAAIGTLTLKALLPTIDYLRTLDIPNEGEAQHMRLYAAHQRAANSWALKVASLLLAAVAGLTFLGFYTNQELASWWGSAQHGRAGLVLAIVETAMVYFGVRGMASLGVASLLLTRMLRTNVTLRPFHPDGCNGLAPLGRLIVLLWLFAIAVGGEVTVALKLGYLGIEQFVITWVLATVSMFVIPLIAIFPLSSSLRSLHKARFSELEKLEPVLDECYRELTTATSHGHSQLASAAVSRLNELRGVHEMLTAVNVWPFNPRALALVVSAYALQLVLTLKDLLP